MLKQRNQHDAYYSLILGKQKDMSDYTPKPDTGTLFINGFKKNDSHPDFTGQYAMPDGTIREMAAWQNGTYLSIKFSDQYEVTNKKTA